MKITKIEQQALRLSMRLAQSKNQLNLAELAEAECLSEALVAKILGIMRRGGVIKANRGRNGGYELAIPAAELSLTRIFKSLGQAPVQGCFNVDDDGSDKNDPCPKHEDCGLKSVWIFVNKKITKLFETITLADLIESEKKVTRKLEQTWKS